jgi:hypothetical protein
MIKKGDTELHYSNWVKTNIMLAKPRDLYLYAGRGLGKTTDILAGRSEDVVREMPRGMFVFTSDTYMNLMTNIVPNIILGWEQRYDFYEGKHFVVDEEPPAGWERPYYSRTFQYKHTISTWNGCKFFLTSLDMPSANAGLSVVHIFGDESKYLREKKLNKLFPTLRGDPKIFGHSPYFLGKTFVSDMANPLVNEDDWMLRMAENMDRQKIVLAIQTGLVINEIERELYETSPSYPSPKGEGRMDKALLNVQRKLDRWKERYNKIRRGSVFFQIVSSYANADILTADYFDNLLRTLDFEEFKTAVLSIRKTLAVNQRFYAKLDEKHFYQDGYDYTLLDRHRLRDEIKETSLMLRYCNHDGHLEAGFDSGNMLSLVIGQQRNEGEYRLLKNFYTIPPKWIRELADSFTEYFKHHRQKVLFLWYDRAANQYRSVGQDVATKLKNAIQKDRFGKDTGWDVRLMSLGQADILHTEEYDLMMVMMGESDRRLPKLRIDEFNCKELKSSLEIAPLKPGTGKEKVMKDKSSERLAPGRLPMESTNMSDAFKYLICRHEWLKALRDRQVKDYEVKVY